MSDDAPSSPLPPNETGQALRRDNSFGLPGHNPTTPAERALAEADARRRTQADDDRPAETGGRAGPEPVRYGDWEKNGLISDF